MGIVVQDDGKRTELQDKVASDLREKIQSRPDSEGTDLVEDSRYTEQLKKTGRFGWFWFVLIFLAVVSVVVILVI